MCCINVEKPTDDGSRTYLVILLGAFEIKKKMLREMRTVEAQHKWVVRGSKMSVHERDRSCSCDSLAKNLCFQIRLDLKRHLWLLKTLEPVKRKCLWLTESQGQCFLGEPSLIQLWLKGNRMCSTVVSFTWHKINRVTPFYVFLSVLFPVLTNGFF